jgi:hypothetical protein
MKQHLTACAFLVGCSGTLALGQQNVEKPWHTEPKEIRQDVEERSWYTVDKLQCFIKLSFKKAQEQVLNG